tara:strand:- start:743 stop:1222 length:480 start_codon:yes stop_codon:yes gene_type:complete
MNQAKKYELMSDYIDGNMTDSEIEDFNKILTNNKELEIEVEEVKAILKKIKSIQPLELSKNFDVSLEKAIKVHNRKQSFSYKILNIFDSPAIATIGSVAAAVALVVVTTIFFSKQASQISTEDTSMTDFSYIEPKNELKNPSDEYFELDINMTGNDIEE